MTFARTISPTCAITLPTGRIGVFFSREDLTAGLVGEKVDGIIGYDPQTASELVRNIILYVDKAW